MARQGRRAWFDLGFLVAAAACAVWSWRTVPVSAMLLVPLAAQQIGASRATAPHRVPRPEKALLAGAGIVALAALAVVVPQTSDHPPSQPSWVDPALNALPPGTKVYGEWDWGGYLMWRYPQLDLLMHGYGDTFTDAELQRNTDITAMAPGWDDQLRRTGCTIAVLTTDRPGRIRLAAPAALDRGAPVAVDRGAESARELDDRIGQGSSSRTTASARSRP